MIKKPDSMDIGHTSSNMYSPFSTIITMVDKELKPFQESYIRKTLWTYKTKHYSIVNNV